MNPAAETTTKYTKNTRIWVSVISCDLADRWLSLPQQQDKAKAKAAGDLPPQRLLSFLPMIGLTGKNACPTRYETLPYCSFSVRRSLSKYESKVTNPVMPWKYASPPVSFDTRLSELCP